MEKIIIANWKCNPVTSKEAMELFMGVINGIGKTKNEVVICPPFLYLPRLAMLVNKKTNIELGSQDCFWAEKGPFTGEVSPAILKDLKIKYVIIGHSERRINFSETDEMINKKLRAALDAGLIPILCIGEKKGENAEEIVGNQLGLDTEGINENDLKKIIIAYEPVWAISTSGGEICSPEYAKKMLEFIKQRFNGKIIYGGSVDSKIINDYLGVGYGGALVGGASLKVDEFINTVRAAE